jgi:hypothetical protein
MESPLTFAPAGAYSKAGWIAGWLLQRRCRVGRAFARALITDTAAMVRVAL